MGNGKIKGIPFSESYRNIQMNYVAVFNSDQISEEEVRKIVESGMADDHPDILVVSFKKWNHIIFNDKFEMSEEQQEKETEEELFV